MKRAPKTNKVSTLTQFDKFYKPPGGDRPKESVEEFLARGGTIQQIKKKKSKK